MNPPSCYIGAASPEAFAVDLVPSASLPDLTVVTAAHLTIETAQTKQLVTWAVELSNQTVTTLRLTHVFASDGGDVAELGDYQVCAYLVTPSGTRRAVADAEGQPGRLRVMALRRP